MGKNKATLLVEELLKTIDTIGIDKTIDTLKITQNKLEDESVIIQEFIISATCDIFSLNKKILLTGKNNRNKTNAIGVCSFLLNHNLNYPQTTIAQLLKKDNSVISKYIKRINSLDKNHKEDIDIIKVLGKLNAQIKEFKIKIID